MSFRQLRYLTVFCALLTAHVSAWAQAAPKAPSFRFAAVEEGRAIMTARDEYIQRLGPIERALKAKSEIPVSEPEFLKLLGSTVLAWSDADRANVQAALEAIEPQLAELKLPMPQAVVFVRTTGVGEGSAPHTRANAIMLTDRALAQPESLPRVLAH